MLARLGLFHTFAINTLGNQSINILAISSVAAALLAVKGRVYVYWLNDILESSFLLNLCVLSIISFYLDEEVSDIHSQRVVSSISVGIAFISFVGILIFHVCYCIKSTKLWKVHLLTYIRKSRLFGPVQWITQTKFANSAEEHTLQVSTVGDNNLREPLIETSYVT